MDEARRVLERLDRIETLRRTDAPAAVLLAQLRRLLAEGERWLAAERQEGSDRARQALDRCRSRLSPDDEEATRE
jgi:hypothetical protein